MSLNKTVVGMLCAVSVGAFLSACGDEVTNSYQTGISVLEAGKKLEKCADDLVGEMVFVKDSAAVYYCDGNDWQTLNGKDGKDGENGSVGEPGENGSNGSAGDGCAVEAIEGGYKIICGGDSVGVVLNGKDGKDGKPGEDGEKGDKGDSDTVVVMYEPVYDTVTTAYLNQEMLAAGKYGILVDKRDNKVYRTIAIGNQTWMAQNLNYYSDAISTYCYLDDPKYCDKLGRMYLWASALNLDEVHFTSNRATTAAAKDSVLRHPVRGVCPEGFHIPDSLEWNSLKKYIDAYNTINYSGISDKISLRSEVDSSGWNFETHPAKDYYGFSAIPSPYFISSTEPFRLVGFKDAEWWSSTEISATTGTSYGIFDAQDEFKSWERNKRDARSIRCLKDAE